MSITKRAPSTSREKRAWKRGKKREKKQHSREQHLNQEHYDREKYQQYHQDIFLPHEIRDAALAFLPPRGHPFTLSKHYLEVSEERNLPPRVLMPKEFMLTDVTLITDTRAIFRVAIRFRWTGRKIKKSQQKDLVVVIEGDWEIVTGYWVRPDKELRYDREVYVQEWVRVGKEGE